MNYNDLSTEQKEKVFACRTADDYIALAKAEGCELSDEEVEQVVGGGLWFPEVTCPKCGAPAEKDCTGVWHCTKCTFGW